MSAMTHRTNASKRTETEQMLVCYPDMSNRSIAQITGVSNVFVGSVRRQLRVTKYLYAIRCEKYVKVGITTDIHKRISSLSTSTPHELVLERSWAIPDDRNLRFIEKQVHFSIASFLHRNEWFVYSEHLLEVIQQTLDVLGCGSFIPTFMDSPSLNSKLRIGIDGRLYQSKKRNGQTKNHNIVFHQDVCRVNDYPLFIEQDHAQ
jgi:hypothetical protein